MFLDIDEEFIFDKPTRKRGSDRIDSVLSEKEVSEIRLLYQKGIKGKGYRPIAKKYKVSQKVIQDIISRKTWRHV